MCCNRSLTRIGVCWSLLSFIAAVAIGVGYYFPYWLIDGKIEFGANSTRVSFGPFRRCGYLKFTTPLERPTLTAQCGRYKHFDDIPSICWKVTTCSVGVGAAIVLLVAFITVPGCCVRDVITRTSARALGMFQVIGAILIGLGMVFFPLGWNNVHVREACGENAAAYVTGSCGLGWSFWCVIGGDLILFICGSLSTRAGRPLEWQRLKENEASSGDEGSRMMTNGSLKLGSPMGHTRYINPVDV